MPDPSVSPADTPTCDYCGSLAWTVEKYGRVTHKELCPYRTDPWHQGDPEPVSSADTIRRAREHIDLFAQYVDTEQAVTDLGALADLAAALLAVGERDRRQIAQLTEAIERFFDGGSLTNLGAVLADEEDAP